MSVLTESSSHPREILIEKYLSITAHTHKTAELKLCGASNPNLLQRFWNSCCMVGSEFQNQGKTEENGVSPSLDIAAHKSEARIHCVCITNDMDFFNRRP